MRSTWARVRALLRRYRSDGRLPPSVRTLVTTTASLRASAAAAEASAATLPVLGSDPGDDTVGASVARMGARRIATAGDLATSAHDLGHLFATDVSEALSAHDIHHFVTGRRGDAIEFGLALEDRSRALEALARLEGAAWYLEWAAGSQSGVVRLDEAPDHRRATGARSWVVFRAFGLGERAVGRSQGARLTFWEQGTSGQCELVGTRGHHRFDPRSQRTTEVIDGRRYPGLTAFPVGATFDHVEQPVDVVYTWVDGSDPIWADSFRATAEACGRSVDESALDPARFRSRDELRYSLRSVWANCGWVRTIWIVTAGQRPDWLVENDRLRIVDHRDILPADALPTFNSHAIEACLHRIDGLAEQFVYFNDDMFVARPVRPELFFTPNGLARVFESGARPPGYEDDDTYAYATAALRGRELLRERFGRVVTTMPYHSPYPLLRSVMFDMETDFADAVERTRRSRFRSSTDLSTASSFAQHYALATRRAVASDLYAEYVHVESGRLPWLLDRIRLGDDVDTFCLNETGVPGGRDDREERIAEFFDDVFPVASPWEAERS